MSPPAASAAQRAPGPRWWIEASGKVWGPYPHERLSGFVSEGRLTAASLVGRGERGPFGPAALEPELTRFFVPEPEASAAETEPAGAARPMLVFAALQATRTDLFEAAVAALGEHVRVAPSLWLLRARCGAAPLRNQLSRRLRDGDVLMVAEVDPAHAAWFAVQGETDRAMRRVLAERRE